METAVNCASCYAVNKLVLKEADVDANKLSAETKPLLLLSNCNINAVRKEQRV